MEKAIEVINTGNELLDGRILNTNGQWIARMCASKGLVVRRITIVGDRLDDIASALKEALSRRPALIVITGGLGPTPDDLTARAVAEALDRPLELNDKALEMVRDFFRHLGQGITPAREKMAWLPVGSRPLENPVGAAPGFLIQHGGTIIVALPGVPEEMKAMFKKHVEPILDELAGGLNRYEARFLIYGLRESDLAPALEEVARANPGVYIKTHPRSEEGRFYLELFVASVASSASEAREKMSKAIMALWEYVSSLGGSMMPYTPE
ncbi:MAG TPA: competence damage-inducible protein A [Candidatus Bathyarchaeota archaeon]|nr:competence damage-inducible protein A [Candidatus Bathyarchaeota archaeon]